jgi:phosphoglycolate phosphatase
MKYKAAIFDLDGTLLNTLEDLTDSVNHALATQNLPLRSLDEIRNFVGNGILKLIERAVPSGRDNPAFDEIYDEFRAYYARHCQDKTAPYAGILSLLEEMAAKKIPMAVVSNKADFAVQELIPVYFSNFITVAHGEDEANGIRKKPAPDMVYQAIKELGAVPEETVYVGDSEVDLQTAANSGLDAIAVSWGFRDREFLKKNGAKTMIDKPEELVMYF